MPLERLAQIVGEAECEAVLLFDDGTFVDHPVDELIRTLKRRVVAPKHKPSVMAREFEFEHLTPCSPDSHPSHKRRRDPKPSPC